jgi:hypothetical protein
MEMQDTNREVIKWKRKCSELEASQQELKLQYESMYCVPPITISKCKTFTYNYFVFSTITENENQIRRRRKAITSSTSCQA